MFLLIFSGIVTVAMLLWEGIIIGGFLFIPEDIRGSFHWADLPIAVYVIGPLTMGGLFCFTLSEYVAFHRGYHTSECQVEKKIITTEKARKDEADTVYFFVRKSNN